MSDTTTSFLADALPPTYEESFSRLGIKATDVPQWLWSSKQCEAWITAFCVTILNKPIEEAEHLAQGFRGGGTMLYSTSVQYWIDTFYGGDDEGVAIFNYIDSVRAQEGAVPPSILDREIENKAIIMAKEMVRLNKQSAREIAKEIMKEMAKEKSQVDAVKATAARQEKRWWHYLGFHASGLVTQCFP